MKKTVWEFSVLYVLLLCLALSCLGLVLHMRRYVGRWEESAPAASAPATEEPVCRPIALLN